VLLSINLSTNFTVLLSSNTATSSKAIKFRTSLTASAPSVIPKILYTDLLIQTYFRPNYALFSHHQMYRLHAIAKNSTFSPWEVGVTGAEAVSPAKLRNRIRCVSSSAAVMSQRIIWAAVTRFTKQPRSYTLRNVTDASSNFVVLAHKHPVAHARVTRTMWRRRIIISVRAARVPAAVVPGVCRAGHQISFEAGSGCDVQGDSPATSVEWYLA